MMAKWSFEARVAELEQIQEQRSTVLEKAAIILGINLKDTIERSTNELVYNSNPRSQRFKEQWILRWLLKTAGITDSKTKTAASDLQQRYGMHRVELKR